MTPKLLVLIQKRISADGEGSVNAFLKHDRCSRVFRNHADKRQNEDDGENGSAHGQTNSIERLKQRSTVDPGGIFHRRRYRVKIPFDHPDIDRDAAQINENESGKGVDPQPWEMLPDVIQDPVI